jgi:hypothetical protein
MYSVGFRILGLACLGLMAFTLLEPQANPELEKQRLSILKLIGVLGVVMLLIRAVELLI